MKNKNLLPFSFLLAMLCGGLVVNAPAQDAASAPTASAQNADENKKMNMYVDLARLVLQAKDAEEGAKIINTILDRVAKLSPTEEDLQRNIKEITAVIAAAITVGNQPYAHELYQSLVAAASKISDSAATNLSLARAAAATGSAVTDNAKYVMNPADKVDALLHEEVIVAGKTPDQVLTMSEAHSLRNLYNEVVRRLMLQGYDIKLDFGEVFIELSGVMSGFAGDRPEPDPTPGTGIFTGGDIHVPTPDVPVKPSPTPVGLR